MAEGKGYARARAEGGGEGGVEASKEGGKNHLNTGAWSKACVSSFRKDL